MLISCHVAPTLLLQEVIAGSPSDSSQFLVDVLACGVNARYVSSTRFTCKNDKENLFLEILNDVPSRNNNVSPLENKFHIIIILTSIQTDPSDHSMQLHPISGQSRGEKPHVYYSSPLTTDVVFSALQFFKFNWRENVDSDVKTVCCGQDKHHKQL